MATDDRDRPADEREQPGKGAPEVPRVPRPEPELPGRAGAPPGPEVPALPRPEPEVKEPTRRRPDAPVDPNAPGQ